MKDFKLSISYIRHRISRLMKWLYSSPLTFDRQLFLGSDIFIKFSSCSHACSINRNFEIIKDKEVTRKRLQFDDNLSRWTWFIIEPCASAGDTFCETSNDYSELVKVGQQNQDHISWIFGNSKRQYPISRVSWWSAPISNDLSFIVWRQHFGICSFSYIGSKLFGWFAHQAIEIYHEHCNEGQSYMLASAVPAVSGK